MRSCPRCRSIFVGNAEFCAVDGEKVLESSKDPLVGTSVDRYHIEARLGQGGMACVYRAKHEILGREHAVKILHGEMQGDKKFAERFRREAQAIAKLDHPNVIKIVDFGVTPEGLHFLVMEFLQGVTLQDVLKDKGPISPKRAAGILKQIASGLAAAHQAGFVHRDLKPGNVMLVKEGGEERAKILDFGLVRIAADDDDEHTRERLTKTGIAMGTPHYMAPEQIRGGETSAQSDLYSLGVVLYEMLSGARPYRGSLPEIIVQQAAEKRQALAPSGGLEELVAELLSTDPKDRPKSAIQVIERIDRLQDLPDSTAKPKRSQATKVQRIRKPSVAPKPAPRKKRRWIGIAAAATVVLAIGSGLAFRAPGKAVMKEFKQAEAYVTSAIPEKQAAPTPPSPKETKEAKDAKDPAPAKPRLDDRAEAARQRTPAAVRPAKPKIDAAALKVRLVRLGDELDRAKKAVPAKKLATMKSQYRTLKNTIDHKNPSEAECRAMATRISEIENELAGAMRGAHSRG